MAAPHDRSIAILIVEDEFLIRVDATTFFESEGFNVFEAVHADEAIRCLERHDEIQLIFTDVNMPGSMNGLALAHYVRGRGPPVKIIVTSGYAKAGARALPENAVFVEKPYALKNIADKINDLIAA
jgi:two-component system, response regulator PdtaR